MMLSRMQLRLLEIHLVNFQTIIQTLHEIAPNTLLLTQETNDHLLQAVRLHMREHMREFINHK